jgi:hypothetical protein
MDRSNQWVFYKSLVGSAGQVTVRPLRLGTDFICDRAARACDRALDSGWVINSRKCVIDAQNAVGCRVVLAISLSLISIVPVLLG